ncbi:MAG: hypothetical protein ACW987_00060 [Candidatus Thorarchaeota archaeon]
METLTYEGNIMKNTKKETIEYDADFLKEWNQFCLSKGLSKRQAAHAACLTFMECLNADQREEAMAGALVHVGAARTRIGSRKKEVATNE